VTKKIKLEFPESEIAITATLLENEEPEMCDLLWKDLAKPVKFACYNTLSTGDYFIGKGRPPKEPVKLGTQANPIGRNQVLLCNLEPGLIGYNGVDISCAYGDHITEPLVSSGAIVAKVDKEYISDFEKAGKAIWHLQYTGIKTSPEPFRQHTMIISRMEE